MNALVWRFVRGTVATAISGFIATWQQNPKYAWLVPVILTVGKAVRDKFPKKFDWLPF